MAITLDKELQKLLGIKKLLENPLFSQYLEKVQELYNCEQAQISEITKDCVKETDLEELNFHIAQRNALGSLLLMKEELEEERRAKGAWKF